MIVFLLDPPLDLTKMHIARQRLNALKEELNGMEENGAEIDEIMKHVDALQGILGSSKLSYLLPKLLQEISFSSI